MNGFSFSASPDAIRWIVETLQTFNKESGFAGLLPTLCFCFNYRTSEKNGRTLEWCPDPYFEIGWYRPETAAAHGFVELEMPGVKFFASPDTLKRLEGKQLILETVEVGYPTPADKKRQLLRAAPRAEGGVAEEEVAGTNGTS